MKTFGRFLAPLAAGLGLAVLAGCSSGGRGGGGDGGGIGGTGGTSSGTITGFGSVFVNGVEFKTGTATLITVDDNTGATENDLKVGMVVKVKHRLAADGVTHEATQIDFHNDVEGPIDNNGVDVPGNRITVLGQAVFVDDALFDGKSLGQLVAGDVVEVSGHRDANGNLRATRVETKAAGVFEVKGTVAHLDTAAKTFTIDALTVNYAAAVLHDLPAGGLADGLLVEVKSTQAPVAGVLTAARVEGKQAGVPEQEGAKVEVEGFVTAFTSSTLFSVDGQPVDATGALFENGTTADLALNVKVEVEGTVNASGTLVAEKVQLKRPRNIKIEANVEARGAASLTVLGITVATDNLTQFEDKKSNLRPFVLNDLAVGDRVEVRAYEATGGSVVASQIVRQGNATDPVILQGKVTSPNAAAGTVTILGVTVNVGGAQLRDQDGKPIANAATFFSGLTAGATVVKAKGTFAAGTLTATEVELEGRPMGQASDSLHGRITRFGSIFVNGVELSLDGAVVSVDDRAATAADLKEGMAVRVEAELNDDRVTGQAKKVEFGRELQGPLDDNGIDPVHLTHAGRLVVLGQTVKLDDLTVFEDRLGPITANQLVNHHVVEVSGFRDDSGVFHATRVDDKGVDFAALPENEKEFELKGAISGFDNGAKTFRIGTQAVDFAGAALPALALADGLGVEVKSVQPLTPAGVLVASLVRLDDNGRREAEGVEVRLEGLVTGFTSAGQFEVQGQTVATTDGTVFKRGTAADLALHRQVEVEGVISNGVLVAKEVSFELERNIKVEAGVDGVNAATGTLTVLGVTVKVDDFTQMKDKTGVVPSFALGDLLPGERVKIRAFRSGAAVVAARVDRDNPAKTRVILQGPATAAADPTVVVLGGTPVDLTAVPANQFRDPAGTQITRAEFLTQAVQASHLVKVRGTKNPDGTITWERAEIETEVEFPDQRGNEFEFEFEAETPG